MMTFLQQYIVQPVQGVELKRQRAHIPRVVRASETGVHTHPSGLLDAVLDGLCARPYITNYARRPAFIAFRRRARGVRIYNCAHI